jgi:arsenite methyltransferase
MDKLSTLLAASDLIGSADAGVLRPGGLWLTDYALAVGRMPRGARVLDVGCGRGAVVRHLAHEYGCLAIGVDLCRGWLQSLPPMAGVPAYVQGAGESLPVLDQAVDYVLAECSLSRMSDQEAALAEFHRVLRPEGALILSDVYARDAGGGTEVVLELGGAGGCRAISMPGLRAGLRRNGFEAVLVEDHSAAWKRLVGRLLMAGGSAESLLGCSTGRATGESASSTPLSRFKLSYFLLIARKEVAGRRPEGQCPVHHKHPEDQPCSDPASRRDASWT